ncbi:MAG TPA: ATP-binding protein [Terriglobales bacterium]|nr:ATP-binding protein [Terriglobales bacterium]
MVEAHRKLGWDLRTVGLGLLTLFLVVMALLNLRQLWVYRQPTDGALWRRTTAGLEAAAAQGPQRGVQPGDLLVAIGPTLVHTPETVSEQLYAAGVGGQLNYTLVRQGRMFTQPVAVQASQPPLGRYTYLEIVGFFYLAIGLFVFYRRRSASQAWNFYLFALASFVLFSFHYTGKLNLFDQTIYWFNEAALLLAPVLLLQFAAGFPSLGRRAEQGSGRRRLRRAGAALLYVPALLIGLAEVALASGAIWLPATLSAVQDVLDRAAYVLLAAYFVAAALMFLRHRRRAAAAGRGQTALQAKVMAWGTFLGLTPFLGLYIIPYVAGTDLPRFANLSVLSLLVVPVAFGYAIWRHHLLEAEIIFRRGVVYTLATALVVAAYWGIIGLAGVLIHSSLPTWGWAGWLVAILVTALLFEPVKSWLQERLDRLFYRERYDYRRTLIEFGRQMNAETDLSTLLEQVLERLAQTLEISHAAIYLGAGEGSGFRLGRARGGEDTPALDSTFLQRHFGAAQAPRLFLEHPDSAARDALHYFLPCQMQGRTVAVIALGRTLRGEFLSSDDVALVETLAGYLAIALENARLYATLRQKADEYQRLKDFNQNIVESIQVGVVATNMMGIVESWNAQMEVLTARPRQLAIGQPLEELLGPEFAHEFAAAATGGGIHSQRKLRMQSQPGDTERIVNLAIAPLVTARYERVGHIVLLSDVTSEVEMEQKLIQADRLRSVGLLAAGVAHEVNTPLAVISSYAQLLAKQTPAGDPRAPVLETITRQTFRASEIVGNLLHFSRTGAAQFREVEVNAVVRDTLALVEHPLRSASIHLIAALHPAAVEVSGDAGKLQQVFLNLILNARDAMPRGGTLTISTGRVGEERAWVEIADTGDGIPAELHHRIFDPFFTTKAARAASPAAAGATMSTGTGLGLAVTYGIVEEHGGSITVRSDRDHGATFRVELPLRAVARPATPVAV